MQCGSETKLNFIINSLLRLLCGSLYMLRQALLALAHLDMQAAAGCAWIKCMACLAMPAVWTVTAWLARYPVSCASFFFFSFSPSHQGIRSIGLFLGAPRLALHCVCVGALQHACAACCYAVWLVSCQFILAAACSCAIVPASYCACEHV